MLIKIITIYCFCADFLNEYGHKDNAQAKLTDAEVMTTTLVAACFFNGNASHARELLLQDGSIPNMLSKSRMNRRLHQISDLTWKAFFDWIVRRSQLRSEDTDFIIDSFPVEVCRHIRASRSKIYTDKSYFGYCASKKQKFLGIKVHAITDKKGHLVQFCLTPGSCSDISALQKMRLELPIGSKLHADKGYTDYKLEDGLRDVAQIQLIAARKSNSKRPHTKEMVAKTRKIRKRIETTFSEIVSLFGRKLHAVTAAGFQLKVLLSLLGYSILKCG